MNIVFEVKGHSYHQTKYGYQGADMCIDGFPLSFSSFIDSLTYFKSTTTHYVE